MQSRTMFLWKLLCWRHKTGYMTKGKQLLEDSLASMSGFFGCQTSQNASRSMVCALFGEKHLLSRTEWAMEDRRNLRSVDVLNHVSLKCISWKRTRLSQKCQNHPINCSSFPERKNCVLLLLLLVLWVCLVSKMLLPFSFRLLFSLRFSRLAGVSKERFWFAC